MLERIRGRTRSLGLAPGALALVALAACAGSASRAIAPPSRFALVYRNAAGELVLANTRGRDARTLGVGSEPLISPSGTLVAALAAGRTGAATVLRIYRTGRRHRSSDASVFAPPSFSGEGVRLLAWSPDSRLLALTADRLSSEGEEAELLVVNVGRGTVTNIATGYFLGASFAPSLPDRLVYAHATIDQLDHDEVELFSADADGSHTRRITTHGLAADPVWGARGIAFARLARLGSAASGPRYGLWMVEPNGSGARALTPFTAGPVAATPAGAAISVSARGARVVADFSSPDSAGAVEVWTASLTRSGRSIARRLTLTKPTVAEGISRNGTQLLVVTAGQSGSAASVATLSWGGTRRRILALDGEEASWNE